MKKIVYLILTVLLFACTKQNVIDTGICSPYHECSMLEYMRNDEYNWKLTVELIERAGLSDVFEGNVDTLPQITFLGIPSLVVERYLYDNDYESVGEIPVALCKRMVLQHVAKGCILKKDVAFRNMDYDINDPLQDGGMDVVMLGGNKIRLYRMKSEYQGVPEAGAETLSAWSLANDWQIPMASPDIQPINGVVHALNYNYVLRWTL